MTEDNRVPKDYWDKIYKRLDARILISRYENGSVVCSWEGGTCAGIIDELMVDISTNPMVGDELDLGGLHVVIVDRSALGDVWFVERLHRPAMTRSRS